MILGCTGATMEIRELIWQPRLIGQRSVVCNIHSNLNFKEFTSNRA